MKKGGFYMTITLINPPEMVKPPGLSYGAMGSGRTLFMAGQIGINAQGNLVSDDLVGQFHRALDNLVRVVEEAGGKPEHIVKINLLVLDKDEYKERSKEIGKAYRELMGRHFPAMTLAEVKGLYLDEAKVEIEAVAMLP
jgi:enamine deaminase RidA (YjgF/YER057c/UK114 family)